MAPFLARRQTGNYTAVSVIGDTKGDIPPTTTKLPSFARERARANPRAHG